MEAESGGILRMGMNIRLILAFRRRMSCAFSFCLIDRERWPHTAKHYCWNAERIELLFNDACALLIPLSSPNFPMPKAQLSAMSSTFKPSESQLLWKKDPRFLGMTITKARDSVNKAIRELVIDLVGKPPAGPFLPHHKGHPVSSPQIGVGKDNYQRIGSYYVMVRLMFNIILPPISLKDWLVSTSC